MDELIGLMSSDKNAGTLSCFSPKNPDQDCIEVKMLKNGHNIFDLASFRSNNTNGDKSGVKNKLDLQKSAFTTTNETL